MTERSVVQRVAAMVAVTEAARDLMRLETPFGAYQRWNKDGNTADADKLQAWEDARMELDRALGQL